MTTLDIEPSMLAQIRDGAEEVVVDTEDGYRRGVRSKGFFTLGPCLGRITICDNGEAYHSMIGARPTFSRAEFEAKIASAEAELVYMKESLSLFHV